VTLCELRGSDMRAPDLAAQVVARVRTFDFGAKDVGPVTILYPIDFLPAWLRSGFVLRVENSIVSFVIGGNRNSSSV
jgi:hypothetical protein